MFGDMTVGCCVTMKFQDRGMPVAPGDKKANKERMVDTVRRR